MQHIKGIDISSIYKFTDEADPNKAITYLEKFIGLVPKTGPEAMTFYRTFLKQQEVMFDNLLDELFTNIDEKKANEIKAYLGIQS